MTGQDEAPTGLATTEEVAAHLRMTEAALRQLRYAGKAPRAAKVGTRLLWKWSDVDAWLEARLSTSSRGRRAA